MIKKNGFMIIDVLFFLFIALLFISIPINNFYTCKVEAKIYNERFGTNYSAYDFFFAGDTIRDYVEKGRQSTNNLNLKIE